MFALEEAPELLMQARPVHLDVAAMFAEHHGFVWRSLADLAVDAADREDVLQEVFVVVHRRAKDYREQQKIRAWLYPICVNVAHDFRRSRRRRREELVERPPDGVRDPSQLDNVANREALRHAEQLLQQLPEKLHSVFLLYEVEQMPMSEVAIAVQCPLQTAYSRLKKARAQVLEVALRAKRDGGAP